MQPSIGQSTAESEYMAISACARHTVWLERMHFELLGYSEQIDVHVGEIIPAYTSLAKSKKPDDIRSAPITYSDSMSALAILHNDSNSRLMRHVDKIHHWCRDLVHDGKLKFLHVAGSDNPSDLLTKWLPLPAFTKHRHTIGLRSWKSVRDGDW